MCWEVLTANRRATSTRESAQNTQPLVRGGRLLSSLKHYSATPSPSKRNSVSAMLNSVKPQSKQTTSIRECQHGGPVQTLPAGKMDVRLRAKLCLVFRPTGSISHTAFPLEPLSFL